MSLLNNRDSQPRLEERDDPLNSSDVNNASPRVQFDAQPILSQYNARSPAVKRILREAVEMSSNEDPEVIHAQPLDDNLFEWHFTFRGPPDTVYSDGAYHGRVVLPSEYPMAPPEIMMLTPSGRFDTNTKICLSISSFHPETWQPSWSIRTALMALRTFMGTDSPGAIGSLECSDAVRKSMALNSANFECYHCGCTGKILKSDNVETETEPTLPSPPRKHPPQAVYRFRIPHGRIDPNSSNQRIVRGADGLEIRGGDVSLDAMEYVNSSDDEYDENSLDFLVFPGGDENDEAEAEEAEMNFVSLNDTRRPPANDGTFFYCTFGFILTIIGGIIIRRLFFS